MVGYSEADEATLEVNSAPNRVGRSPAPPDSPPPASMCRQSGTGRPPPLMSLSNPQSADPPPEPCTGVNSIRRGDP